MKRIIILFSATIAAASFGQSALNNPEGMIWDNYLDGIPALDVPAEADGHLTRWEVSEDGFDTSLISSSLTESNLINAVGLATNAAQRSELDAYATTNALSEGLAGIAPTWTAASGGLRVADVPSSKDGYISRWGVPDSWNGAVLVENFDNAGPSGGGFGNEVDSSAPYVAGNASFESNGKFGSCLSGIKADYTPTYLYKNSWGEWDETTSFTMSVWFKNVISYEWESSPIMNLISEEGTKVCGVWFNKYGDLKLYAVGTVVYDARLASLYYTNVWKQFCISYDASTQTFYYYLNGILINASTVSGTWTFAEHTSGTVSRVEIVGNESNEPNIAMDDFVLRLNVPPTTSAFTVPTEAYSQTEVNPYLTASTLTETDLVNAVGLATNAAQRSELAAYATTNALADYATTTELQTAFAHAEEVMTTIYSGLMTFEEEITPVLSSHSDTLAELGSAAFVDVESFATAEQGSLAENAMQVTGGTLRGDLDCGFNSITNVTAIGTDEETLASYNNVDERWTVNAEHIVADGEMTISSSVGVITCAGQTFKALDDVELTGGAKLSDLNGGISQTLTFYGTDVTGAAFVTNELVFVQGICTDIKVNGVSRWGF